MDWDDVYDWIALGLARLRFPRRAGRCPHRARRHRPPRHQIRSALLLLLRARPPPPFIEEPLESIPDVAYQELPDAAGGDDGDSCVICVTPYQACSYSWQFGPPGTARSGPVSARHSPARLAQSCQAGPAHVLRSRSRHDTQVCYPYRAGLIVHIGSAGCASPRAHVDNNLFNP
jgi:hypothetical protein